MKYTTLCFFAFSLFCSSCAREDMEITETMSCITNDYQDHSKNEQYLTILEKYRKLGLPGISVSIYHEDTLWQGAIGYASIEQQQKLQPCHLAYSASVGKTYCATAILLLAEQGKLQLDDRIDEYLSQSLCDKIANGHTATIRQLLNHSSGIPNVDDNTQFGTTLFNAPYSLTREKIIGFMSNKKALHTAGDAYHYSSTGYELLTKIIDKVTEEPHELYIREQLLMAHGLIQTYYHEDFNSLATQLPNNYFERYGNGKIENISQVNFHLQNTLTGSDGIIASPTDYVLFLQKLLQGDILSEASLAEMKSFIPVDGSTDEGYGLGLRIKKSPFGHYLGHGGRSLGAGMDLYHFPDSNTTICLSTNLGTYVESDLVNLYQGPLWVELVTAIFTDD